MENEALKNQLTEKNTLINQLNNKINSPTIRNSTGYSMPGLNGTVTEISSNSLKIQVTSGCTLILADANIYSVKVNGTVKSNASSQKHLCAVRLNYGDELVIYHQGSGFNLYYIVL